jgi:hypothetical protein
MPAAPRFSSIFSAGISSDRPAEFFPTLVVETAEKIEIGVLDPQPSFDLVEELIVSWIEQSPLVEVAAGVFAVAFLKSEAEMEAWEGEGGQTRKWVGRVDWGAGTVDWHRTPS